MHTGVNGLEFAVKTDDFKGMIRSSSVDMLEHFEEEYDSCHSRMKFSSL